MEARVQTAPATVRDAGTRITVVVRVRPPNQREVMSQQGNVIHVLDDRVLIFDPPGERIQKQTFLKMGQQRAKNLHFGFDKVLSPSSTQEDVFDVVKDSVFAEKGGLLDGFNCTVFAYGATGSGKTFSMAGNPENPGLMSRAVQYIFTALEQQGRKAKLKLSYLEIYNEQIRDLLAPNDDQSKELKIVEDPENGIVVTNLRHCYPESTDEVLELIQIGNNRRTQAQTDSNPVSSRSHAVCQITVENCEDVPGIQADHPIGKLSLIDLAGSERATTNTGIRLKESAKINCSLLALSNCINALCTQSSFIPFRQSKLTRLLKDSLGGNCKTVCLSCVSPSYMTYDDTYSTLQYANKTKNIRTNITRNTLNVKARISQYPKIIAELRAQILALQSGQGGNTAAVDQFKKSIEEPFKAHKNSIQVIVDREMAEIPSDNIRQQILALQRMANSDLKRKLNQKVAVFAAECNKRRPSSSSAPTKAIDNEQRLKILELENFALRSQLEIREKQISMQQNVIKSLNQTPTHDAPPALPLSHIAPPKAAHTIHHEVPQENEDLNTTPALDESDAEAIKSIQLPPPVSARRHVHDRVSITDMSRIKTNAASEASKLLKQKLQDAQKMHQEARKPLADRTSAQNVQPSAVSKPPIRSLMDQLSQRVAAANLSLSNHEEPTGILLRSRLLTQKPM